jgi:hypothetical protein
MIKWQYGHIFVAMHGNSHVVAGINGQLLDYQRNPQTPWDVLNAMGREGWELVTALPTTPMQYVREGKGEVAECFWVFYLKRPELASET